jgi:hypothetical protein
MDISYISQSQADRQVSWQVTRPCVIQGLSLFSGFASLALFVIGCIGAAGILPSSTMGWSAIGLGGAGFLLHITTEDKWKERKMTLLIGTAISLLPVVLGALGVTGILSGIQVGWGLIGIPLTTAPIICCLGVYYGQKIVREAGKHNPTQNM